MNNQEEKESKKSKKYYVSRSIDDSSELIVRSSKQTYTQFTITFEYKVQTKIKVEKYIAELEDREIIDRLTNETLEELTGLVLEKRFEIVQKKYHVELVFNLGGLPYNILLKAFERNMTISHDPELNKFYNMNRILYEQVRFYEDYHNFLMTNFEEYKNAYTGIGPEEFISARKLDIPVCDGSVNHILHLYLYSLGYYLCGRDFDHNRVFRYCIFDVFREFPEHLFNKSEPITVIELGKNRYTLSASYKLNQYEYFTTWMFNSCTLRQI